MSSIEAVVPAPALATRLGPLLDDAAGADGRPALSDHLMLDLTSHDGDAVGVLAVRDARPIAYAQASRANEGFTSEVVVHPDARADPELLDDIVAALTAAVAAAGGGQLDWWIHRPSPATADAAERHGFRTVRSLHRMAAPLPVERHAEVETRAFVAATDEEPWLAVNNRAFAEHGEQGGWTLATLRQREAEEWFDPAGFRVHERDGRMAAFCWTKVHGSDPEFDGAAVGEIYVIAVDPDFHGLGLGSQLTLAGLDHLSAQGLQHAILYVDAANEVAVSMYERLGFAIASTSIAVRREVVA